MAIVVNNTDNDWKCWDGVVDSHLNFLLHGYRTQDLYSVGYLSVPMGAFVMYSL